MLKSPLTFLSNFYKPTTSRMYHPAFKFKKSMYQRPQPTTTIRFSECTVKLGDKERFDKEQIGVKEPFPMNKCQFTS